MTALNLAQASDLNLAQASELLLNITHTTFKQDRPHHEVQAKSLVSATV
jgi:hypothetical protein